jgi:hypothetical protein
MAATTELVYEDKRLEVPSRLPARVAIQRAWETWRIAGELWCGGVPLVRTPRRVAEVLAPHLSRYEVPSTTLLRMAQMLCPLDQPIGQLARGRPINVVLAPSSCPAPRLLPPLRILHSDDSFECFAHDTVLEVKRRLFSHLPRRNFMYEELELPNGTLLDNAATMKEMGADTRLSWPSRNKQPADYCFELLPPANSTVAPSPVSIGVGFTRYPEAGPERWPDENIADYVRIQLFHISPTVCHPIPKEGRLLVWSRSLFALTFKCLTTRHSTLTYDACLEILQYLTLEDWQPATPVSGLCVDAISRRTTARLDPCQPLKPLSHYMVRAETTPQGEMRFGEFSCAWHFYTGHSTRPHRRPDPMRPLRSHPNKKEAIG